MESEPYQDGIKNYFYLDKQITQAYEALEELRQRHENRNYYTKITFHELGFSTQNFNLEREAADFVDAERLALDRIGRMKARLAHFNQMLNALDPQEQFYLKQRYKEGKHFKEQPHIEEKALALVEEMEEYKFELSRYRRNTYDRAQQFKEAQEIRDELKRKRQKESEQADAEYNEWLESIENVITDKALLVRMRNLQR